jgi:hypothetical protein
MAAVEPREAFAYALSRGMLTLYGVVLLGYVGLIVGTWLGASWGVRGGGAGLIGQFLGAALVVAGFVAVLGGLVALVYKVIADANEVAA